MKHETMTELHNYQPNKPAQQSYAEGSSEYSQSEDFVTEGHPGFGSKGSTVEPNVNIILLIENIYSINVYCIITSPTSKKQSIVYGSRACGKS